MTPGGSFNLSAPPVVSAVSPEKLYARPRGAQYAVSNRHLLEGPVAFKVGSVSVGAPHDTPGFPIHRSLTRIDLVVPPLRAPNRSSLGARASTGRPHENPRSRVSRCDLHNIRSYHGPSADPTPYRHRRPRETPSPAETAGHRASRRRETCWGSRSFLCTRFFDQLSIPSEAAAVQNPSRFGRSATDHRPQ